MEASPALTSAGLVRRLVARLIDTAIAAFFGVIVGVACVFAIPLFGSDLGIDDDVLSTLGDLVILLMGFALIAGPVGVALLLTAIAAVRGPDHGRTTGRRVMGLHLALPEGGHPSAGRAVLHGLLGYLAPVALVLSVATALLVNAGGLFALAALVIPVIEVITVLVRRDDRALHDVLAGITVVKL